MIRLTNAMVGNEGRPVAVNAAYVVSVYTVFDGETRVRMLDDDEYVVSETFDEVLAAVSGRLK